MEKKKRKRIILIVIAILVVITALLLTFSDFLRDRLEISPDNLFPFGSPSNRQPDQGQATTTPPVTGGVRPDEFIPIERDRLRLVTSESIVGYTPLDTNRFYLSQAAIEAYNSSRGDIDVNELEVIRSPLLRAVTKQDLDVNEFQLNTTTERREISQNTIPSVHEVDMADGGENLVVRRYDRDTSSIETFVGRFIQESRPIECSTPFRSLELGETHPGVQGVRNALSVLYQQNTEPSDTITSELIDLVREFEEIENLATSTEDILSTSTLATLQTSCEVAAERLNENILPASLTGQFIDIDISDTALEPISNQMFTIRTDGQKGRGEVVQLSTPSNGEFVFESNFREWLTEWPAGSASVFLQTKPSYNAIGNTYRLEPNTNRFEKILGNKLGLLATVSPNEQYVLYSYTDDINGDTLTALLDLQTRRERVLSFATLPDKCGWSRDSRFAFCGVPRDGLEDGEPDNWFKGVTSFTDEIWVIDTQNFITRLMYSPTAVNNEQLDIYKMQVDPFENNYIYFIDKKTEYLWSLEIDGIDGRVDQVVEN